MRYRLPKPLRDLADADYLHKLTREERWLYLRFIGEYYNAHASSEPLLPPEELAARNRWKQTALLDAFCRSGELAPSDAVGEIIPDVQLESPKARELLAALRELRPEPPEGDRRRKPEFKTKLQKEMFDLLQRELKELLREDV